MDPESDSVASLQGEFATEPYVDNGFTNTIAGMDLGTEMLTNGDRYSSLSINCVFLDATVLFCSNYYRSVFMLSCFCSVTY